MDFRQGGKALQRIRKEQGLTQETLGEMSGASTVTISRIERGVIVPSISTLIAICNALEVGTDSVLSAYINTAAPIRWTALADNLEKLDASKKARAEAIIESVLDNN